MAEEVVTETLEAVKEEVIESVTEAVNGTAAKVPATTEGMMVAYGSLVIMALFPIFVGSYRSILTQQKQKDIQVQNFECGMFMQNKCKSRQNHYQK